MVHERIKTGAATLSFWSGSRPSLSWRCRSAPARPRRRGRIRHVIRLHRALSDRTGPRGIADRPRHDMQMELAKHVAERADIDLVALRVRKSLPASAVSSMRSARSLGSMSVSSTRPSAMSRTLPWAVSFSEIYNDLILAQSTRSGTVTPTSRMRLQATLPQACSDHRSEKIHSAPNRLMG